MKNSIRYILLLLVLSFLSCVSDNNLESENVAENLSFFEKTEVHYKAIDISDFADGFNHARYEYPNSIPPWSLYETTQILGLAENMVYLQNPDGGWAKNLDLQRKYTLEELEKLQKSNKSVPPVTYEKKTDSRGSTIDNGNIFSQIKYLAQVYVQVPDARYIECLTKAVNWILNAQHPTSGGWTGSDVFAITYNDDVMSDTLRTLKSIATDDTLYGVLPKEIRQKAQSAYDNGIQCILNTQITITKKDGTKQLTAWCQQHSHTTLQPIWAREFEPPSICTSESKKIIELLMEIENPSEQIKKAIIAASEWLSSDEIKIVGKKIIKNSIPGQVLNGRYYDTENVMVDDPNSILWARFYALDSSFDLVTGARKPITGTYPEVNTPIWCDRGCSYVQNYNDLSLERRNGYGYVGNYGKNFASKLNSWKTKNGI